MRSQSSALLLVIDRQSPEQDDRDRIRLIAPDPAAHVRVYHRAGRQAVIAHDASPASRYVGPGTTAGLITVRPTRQPLVQLSLATLESIEAILCGERPRDRVAPAHSKIDSSLN